MNFTSPVQQYLAPSDADVAAAILGPMNEQFALMNLHFAQMRARHTNSFAGQPGDTIVPLPVLPQAGVVVPPLPATADVAAAILGPMNEQFALMNAHFAQMRARHANRFAEQPGDIIVPLPVLPQAGVPEPPLPACYPENRQELMDLPSPDVNTLLEYYGEPTNGPVNTRRAQLVAFLGMPPSR
jgi:hypothetical protein